MTETIIHRVGTAEVPFAIEHVPGAIQAFFVLGIRKSGSSIFNSIVNALAQHNKVPFVDVGGVFFDKNIRVKDWIGDVALQKILRPGILYGGFRNFPIGLATAPLFKTGRKALLVRDPRDALVSEYFSTAYSHSLPEGDATGGEAALLLAQREAALQTQVNEFVLRQAQALSQTLQPLLDLTPDGSLLVLRYEDVILQKRVLIRKVASHFDWACDEGLVEGILSWADVRPDAENPRAFIRKVTPGDHREKLSPSTIAELNARFAPFMNRFGYT